MSALLFRDGKQIKRDLRTEEQEEWEREPMERQSGGKMKGYAGVENDEEQLAFRIQMRKNGVMEERRSCSKVKICTWLAIGDKYAKRSSEQSHC